MKRLLLIPARIAWRALGPIRRPADRRIEAWYYHAIEPRVRELSAEVMPGLHGLLRELARLQQRVDELEDTLAERTNLAADEPRKAS